jgi:hypothetical protein
MYFLYKNDRKFKLVEITIRKGGKKEQNGGDKPTPDVIHTYMEMS